MSDESEWAWEWSDDGDDRPTPEETVYPPEVAIGGSVALDLVLGRDLDTAVWLTSFRAYRGGVACLLEIRAREGTAWLLNMDDDAGWGSSPGGLRWGLRLADGSAAEPDWRGGTASERHVTYDYWIAPLPPPGAMVVWSEWPERGFARSERAFDAAPFAEAAARSQVLWDDRPEPDSVTPDP